MGVIIGAGTTVSFYGACAVSANWGYNPNSQRLYCLGETTPRFNFNKPTETLSIVIYSGTGGPGTVDVTASQVCGIADQLIASVSPAACEGAVGSITGSWFPVNYGYSKDDPLMPGQETWGMQRWVADSATGTPAPTNIVRGISEGQGSIPPDDADPGITFDTGTLAYSQAGNVSAGGMGRNDQLQIGTATSIYGGEGTANGKTGQGSASIPHTPLWV